MEVENGRRLVLTRNPGERIIIGDPMSPTGIIEIVEAKGRGSARLACIFPPDVPVHREEIVANVSKYADVISAKNKER